MVTEDEYVFGIFCAVLLTTVVVSLIALVIGLAKSNDRLQIELRKKKKDE